MTGRPGPSQLAVIVPLGPGETEQAGLLAQLRGLPPGSEVLVVGAGSAPEPPPDWPGGIAWRGLAGPAGRARQLNFGASETGAAWLWFLHADTRLSEAALPALDDFLGRGEAALGWFRLRFRADGPRLAALNAAGANLRSSWFGLPFGDQGLVVPAADLRAAGGYDETVPRGEDLLLVRSLRRAGLPLRAIDADLHTSARKYARHGWARTTLDHWIGTVSLLRHDRGRAP